MEASSWQDQAKGNPEFYETKHPGDKARLLGYLMGDGSVIIRKEKRGIMRYDLRFYPDDDEMLGAFLESFKVIYDAIPHITRMEKYMRVSISSKAIVEDLATRGSFKSMEWRVPDFPSKEEKVEFLRAFFDCEAYVAHRGIRVESVNYIGLLQIQGILNEFSIRTKMYKYITKFCES
jgi:intein/homing endonuclease